MKKIVTTNITTGAAAKIKSGTLEHLNEMSKEAISEVVASIVGESWDNTKCYILYGLENSGAGLNYIMTAGAIWYAGEVYIIPSQTITVGGGQILKFDYATSYTSAANADPVTFTDGSTHNIHKNTSGVWIGAATSASLLEYAYMTRATKPTTQTLTLTANYSVSGGITPKCRKNRDGLVSLQGLVLCGAGAAVTQTITTLPVGYRPSVATSFITVMSTGAAFTQVLISITTAGLVVLTQVGAGPNTYIISFDGMTFYNN